MNLPSSPAMPVRTGHRRSRAVAMLVALLAVVLLLAVGDPTPARADGSLAEVLEADTAMQTNPAATVAQAQALGISVIRLDMPWESVAPDAGSFRTPAGFNGANPDAYAASSWAPFDNAIAAAQRGGIRIDLDLMGGTPLWATGPGMPRGSGYPHVSWEPNATAYGAFVRAVGERYSGNFDPVTGTLAPGNPDDLPRVDFFSIWNEPDYGPSLSPQAIPGSKSVPDAPRLLRGLIDAAWSSLAATGHRTTGSGANTIIWGELAPRGTPTFGNFNGMLPVPFLQALYCVGANYKPLTGHMASLLGCPTTASGRSRFAAANPALFHASGVSVHPYMRWYPPNDEEYNPRFAGVSTAKWRSQYLANYTTLAVIGHLTTALDRLVRVYHGTARYPIWDTEFGYLTSPPKRRTRTDPYPWVSTQTAAIYDNWAEYISYTNPRIASFDQYLIQDPEAPTAANDYGNFASGLITWNGIAKPGYAAFQMPIFLPSTTATSSGQRLLVWGAVKPARFAGAAPQTVELFFKPSGAASYALLDTVSLSRAEDYEARIALPGSGTLLAQWTPPLGTTGSEPSLTGPLDSRTVTVTVR